MDSTFAEGKSEEFLQQHYMTVMGVQDAMPKRVMDDARASAILDGAGVDLILHYISLGWTRTEIASHFGVPPMGLAKWVSDRLSPEDLAVALQNFADALVTRGMYSLTYRHASDGERSMMKEFSKMARDLAACASPDQWMPSRISGANTQAVTPVSINIDMGGALPQTAPMVTVPSVSPGFLPLNLPTPPASGVGLSPTDVMPAPAQHPQGHMTVGWIFGDTTPDAPGTTQTEMGSPPTRERPNG